MMLLHRVVTFHGSKEKLQRYVKRERGKFLGEQRFYLDLREKRIKQHRAFPFRFHCRFQKMNGEYEIHYFVTPSPFGLVRMGIFFAVLAVMPYLKPQNPYVWCGGLVIIYFLVLFMSGQRCVKEFEETCRK